MSTGMSRSCPASSSCPEAERPGACPEADPPEVTRADTPPWMASAIALFEQTLLEALNQRLDKHDLALGELREAFLSFSNSNATHQHFQHQSLSNSSEQQSKKLASDEDSFHVASILADLDSDEDKKDEVNTGGPRGKTGRGFQKSTTVAWTGVDEVREIQRASQIHSDSASQDLTSDVFQLAPASKSSVHSSAAGDGGNGGCLRNKSTASIASALAPPDDDDDCRTIRSSNSNTSIKQPSKSVTDARPSTVSNSARRGHDATYYMKDCWEEISLSEEMPETMIAASHHPRRTGKGIKDGRGALVDGAAQLDQKFVDLAMKRDINEDEGWRRNVVASPNSQWRFCWDIISMILICIDLVTIPMQFFRVYAPMEFMVFCNSFWSLDLIMNFFVGYYDKGILEMRLVRTVAHYTFSWLPFDAVVVSVDWAVLSMGGPGAGAGESSGVGRTVKSLRVFRTLRSLRLLRIVKWKRCYEEFKSHLHSDLSRTVLNVLSLILFIVSVNHVIACCWFGVSEAEHLNGRNAWISSNVFNDTERLAGDDMALGYAYTTALHWSLTQFTPASMEIVPRNTSERTFTVMVIVFALVVFSSFLSSLTSTMTRYHAQRTEHDRSFELLRKFLRDRHVSHILAVRLQRYLEHKTALQRRRIEIADVSLLKLLSDPLRMDLDQEIYGPILGVHPFFQHYARVDAGAMRRLCHTSVSRMHLSDGDKLFSSGEPCNTMYFLLEGRLAYTASNKDKWEPAFNQCPTSSGSPASAVKTLSRQVTKKRMSMGLKDLFGGNHKMGETSQSMDVWRRPVKEDQKGNLMLEEGSWCCEASLWTQWNHQGVMRAETNCSILCLDANQFCQITSAHGKIGPHAAIYADSYIKAINKNARERTDLPLRDYDTIIEDAFFEKEEEQPKKLVQRGPTKALRTGGTQAFIEEKASAVKGFGRQLTRGVKTLTRTFTKQGTSVFANVQNQPVDDDDDDSDVNQQGRGSQRARNSKSEP